MQTLKFQERGEWLNARLGKITGSRLASIIVKRGTTPKKGFYELISERISMPADDENPMDRGTRLEQEAIDRFSKEEKKKVDSSLIMWVSDENESMAISPDGVIGKTEAVEVKCLNSASHIEAWLTQKLPSDYEMQVIQYFIVNDQLKKLYFIFYDPRVPAKPFFFFTLNRKDYKDLIEQYRQEQLDVIKSVDEIVCSLSNF